jgi:hypothetical protein
MEPVSRKKKKRVLVEWLSMHEALSSNPSIPKIEGRKENCLICCKNFCKCHNVPPHSTTIKKKERK